MILFPHDPCGLLCSGGMESGALAYLCSQQAAVHPIYVRFGLTWEQTELQWLSDYLTRIANPNLRPLVVLDQPVGEIYKDHWSRTGNAYPAAHDPDESVYLPGRNLLLLAKSAVFCCISNLPTILIGTLRGNPFPDARPEFFAEMANVVSLACGRPFQILAPFSALTKETVIRLAASAPLDFTFSCIYPRNGRHCGKCNKCGERKRHFRLAGMEDRTSYESTEENY